MNTIAINGINIKLKRYKKSKRLKIFVNAKGEPVITSPSGVPLSRIKIFAQENYNWLLQNLQKKQKNNIQELKKIEFFSREYVFRFKEFNVHKVRIDHESGHIYIFRPITEYNENYTRLELIKQLKKLATRELIVLTNHFAISHGFSPNKISIKDQISKWGSCSSAGNINFSWRLGFAPREVYEYVIVHELCHLTEPNHGKDFWKLVAGIKPDFVLAKNWLKSHGQSLHILI